MDAWPAWCSYGVGWCFFLCGCGICLACSLRYTPTILSVVSTYLKFICTPSIEPLSFLPIFLSLLSWDFCVLCHSFFFS